ncbi:hypothetical protein PAPYR_13393 [Paratrimastix pyriformis]|uniref:START domain-containing protein n=1 Tax=Paratrimastix pyriformis TaxID=342808 RepID=A0ABQ8U3T0_9EUKA|nr:hypothetical protein PAPYR_13393 [Paratrimastix pyriformis]
MGATTSSRSKSRSPSPGPAGAGRLVRRLPRSPSPVRAGGPRSRSPGPNRRALSPGLMGLSERLAALERVFSYVSSQADLFEADLDGMPASLSPVLEMHLANLSSGNVEAALVSTGSPRPFVSSPLAASSPANAAEANSNMQPEAVLQESEDFMNNPSWTFVKEEDGVRIFSMEVESGRKAFKGDCRINKPFMAMYYASTNETYRKQWDSMFMGVDCVEDIDASTAIMNPRFHGGVASNRDMCIFYTKRVLPTGVLTATKSVEDPRCPPQKGFVRARVIISGMKFVPRGENECEVTYVGQVDLAGWAWLHPG